MNHIEIFRAGTRRDANGQLITITSSDLKAIADNYHPEFHEAPLVIGHPKSDLPAYGWVKSLSVDGEVLKAEVDQVDTQFAELVSEGRFKKVSAAFYLPTAHSNPKSGAYYLRHVGFLGATPPAVKGLRNPEFSDAADEVVEFVEAMGEEDMPQQSLATLDEPKEKEVTMDHEKELEALRAENARLIEAIRAQEKAKVAADNAQFAEQLIEDGRLVPALREQALALLNADMQSVEFAEDNFKTNLKAFMGALPQAISAEAIATPKTAESKVAESVEYAEGTDPVSIQVDQKLRQYMAEHDVDYATAFDSLYK